jgi:hypothetical protein
VKRPPLLVLIFCLLVGAGLVVALISRNHSAAGATVTTTKASGSVRGSTGGAGGGMSAAGADAAEQSASMKALFPEAWQALLSSDLKALVANLRAAGFPPKVIRAIVAAMLDEQYAERRRKILGDQPAPPYWKAGSMLSMLTSPQMSELRALAREEQDTLKQLLGPDSATSELNRFIQQRMYGDLAPEKIDAVQRIQQDYNDLRSQIYADASGGVMLPWDREKLALLDKEQRADLAAVLSPEELQQYDLRSSSTAQRLRTQLTYFNPTEQEFLAIYNLQSQFDQSHNSLTLGFQTSDQMRQRQADQQQLQEQIKAVLGDQRYVDYQQSTDYGFQAANRIVSTLQLPQQNAVAAWNLQQSIQQQASAIRADRGLPSDQRFQALAALGTQAEQQLTTLLTQQGADAYKQTPGGSWLRSLEMSSRRPSPPPATGTAGSSQTSPTTTTPPRG